MKTKLMAALGACVIAAASFTAAAAETLRVGTEAAYAPFEYIDSVSGDFAGFDVDLIRELAKRAGYEIKLMNMGYDGLIPALTAGTIDLAISGMIITKPRKRFVEFSDPYYEIVQGMMIWEEDAAKYTDKDSLKGARVAVQIGTTSLLFARKIRGAEVKVFNSVPDAFLALRNREADAVIIDRPAIDYFMDKRPDQARGFTALNVSTEIEYLGFCVKKGNTETINRFNQALKDIRADGTYEKLCRKWFRN